MTTTQLLLTAYFSIGSGMYLWLGRGYNPSHLSKPAVAVVHMMSFVGVTALWPLLVVATIGGRDEG